MKCLSDSGVYGDSIFMKCLSDSGVYGNSMMMSCCLRSAEAEGQGGNSIFMKCLSDSGVYGDSIFMECLSDSDGCMVTASLWSAYRTRAGVL